MSGQLVLFENVGFGGRSLTLNDGQNTSTLAPPLSKSASSLKSTVTEWLTLWETAGYNTGDDQWWIQNPPPGHYWAIDNFPFIWRPHGTNNWNDIVGAVSFSGPPSGDTDNMVILYQDGHWGGNLGILGFYSTPEHRRLLQESIRLEKGEITPPKYDEQSIGPRVKLFDLK